uniref:hydroxysqualene dehydroxylase n=1 Tax=Undibacterium luofuense TaxID=2828733 RepID=UPI0030EB3E50
RDSLGAGRAASDMLIPRAPLGAILPELAIRYLQQQQMTVQTGMPVRALHRHGDHWSLSNAEATFPGQFDQVVIATDIRNCQRLLASVSDADTTPTLPDYQFEAITTVYLQYPATVRLDRAFYALPDHAASQHYGQFVFDRGWLDTQQAGLMAVVISAPSTLPDAETLAALVAQQLATQTGIQALAQPLWHQVITEKRATWACTPGIRRPSQATGISGLWIAGDYTDAAYPATLESAVRSGKQLASLIRGSARQAR